MNLISTDYSRSYIKQMLRNYRATDVKRWGAKVKTVTYDEVLELMIAQRLLCFWTDAPLELPAKDGRRKPSQISIDRLDNDSPHTYDNVVLVAQSINLMRSNYTMLDWLLFLEKLGCLGNNGKLILDDIKLSELN